MRGIEDDLRDRAAIRFEHLGNRMPIQRRDVELDDLMHHHTATNTTTMTLRTSSTALTSADRLKSFLKPLMGLILLRLGLIEFGASSQPICQKFAM